MPAHPVLLPLVGRWQGGGKGMLPDHDPFRFDEEITFTDLGNGDLAYLQRAWMPMSGEVLHAEAGIWRVNEVGLILTISLPRVVEVSIGAATADRWEVASTQVARAPGGARLISSRRRYWLTGGELAYEIDLQAGDAMKLTSHLSAHLGRAE